VFFWRRTLPNQDGTQIIVPRFELADTSRAALATLDATLPSVTSLFASPLERAIVFDASPILGAIPES
jgi:hypothetical protein